MGRDLCDVGVSGMFSLSVSGVSTTGMIVLDLMSVIKIAN